MPFCTVKRFVSLFQINFHETISTILFSAFGHHRISAAKNPYACGDHFQNIHDDA